MLNWLWKLNATRRRVRMPLKCLIVALTVLLVCYPNPMRLTAHLRHWSDPNAMIDPHAPALQPLVEELRPQMRDASHGPEALRIVQKFVYAKIPYDWDWNTWGSVDYLPTVTEVLERGREDCDGQAVLAASLLRNFGYEAELVANFAHMWVRTDRGETMNPGKNQAVVASKTGPKYSWRGLWELPKATAFGISVFPLPRELVVLAVLWLMLLCRNRRALRQILTLILFTVGLLLLRFAGSDYRNPNWWLQAVAVVMMLVGVIAQVWRASRQGERSDPESDAPA